MSKIEQSTAAKFRKQGFTLREIERILRLPASRKSAGARDLLKKAEGKRRVGGVYV